MSPALPVSDNYRVVPAPAVPAPPVPMAPALIPVVPVVAVPERRVRLPTVIPRKLFTQVCLVSQPISLQQVLAKD